MGAGWAATLLYAKGISYRKECYVLKLDIEGYFMNISRQWLYDMIVSRLRKYSTSRTIPFDLPVALRLLAQVVFNDPVKGCYRKGRISDWNELPSTKSLFYAAPGCGLLIGNLTSQLFSNVYLSVLDDYVKRVLRCRHYGRYVDDFYIVGCCKEELLATITVIRGFLSRELGLKLHPRKIHLTDVGKGVRFLGAVVKPYQRYVCRGGLSRANAHVYEVLTDECNPYTIRSVIQSYKGYRNHFM